MVQSKTTVSDAEARAYIQQAAGSQSTADQLSKLADLRDRGVITADEFEREKAKVLAARELAFAVWPTMP